jgi:SAM-dependent methyltransferase
MNLHSSPDQVSFDEYADDYDAALQRGIAVSGEGKDFFAEGRVRWLARCLEGLGFRASAVMDYGCGTGSATPYFFELLGAQSLLGLDLSRRSVELARANHGSGRTTFQQCQEFRPCGDIDLVFCNGVFHHIPPVDRPGVVRQIFDALRPGGLFALWENNPFNPGTRLVMSRIPFDRDAVLVWPWQARRLLREAGLRIVRTDYLFVFPRFLKALRPAEPFLCGLPLGAQYQVLGIKGA